MNFVLLCGKIRIIMLSSYAKSLIAGGLALLAVIYAGFWFRSRVILLNELSRAGDALKTQMANSRSYPAFIVEYEKRLAVLLADTKKITDKFVDWDYKSPKLVQAVVKAASLAGLEMTNASKLDKKTKTSAEKDKAHAVQVLTHAITLKGSYTGLVKFLQNLAAWNISHKIESIEVTPSKEGKAGDEVEVSFVLSVFSLDQPTETKSYSP